MLFAKINPDANAMIILILAIADMSYVHISLSKEQMSRCVE